jgi:hypothetical protein
MTVKEIEDGTAEICRSILGALPWLFGRSTATAQFTEQVARQPAKRICPDNHVDQSIGYIHLAAQYPAM